MGKEMRSDEEILKEFEKTELPQEGKYIADSERSQRGLILEVLLDIRALCE